MVVVLPHRENATNAGGTPANNCDPAVRDTEGAADRQLADTLARDLTSTFERSVRSARVTSPTLAATYRDKAIDARTVGRELGVGYLVEGEIRRAGEQLTVDVKIVDAGTATQTWSDRLQVEDSQMKHAAQTLASRLVARLAVISMRVVHPD